MMSLSLLRAPQPPPTWTRGRPRYLTTQGHGRTVLSFTSLVWSPVMKSRRSGASASAVTMRDRSKNRKPTQRGRYLSIEAIQAVQALKCAARTAGCGGEGDRPVERVVEAKVRRLVKRDLVAVLRELQDQGEGLLALQVFEEVRKEHWYRPELSMYVDMIRVLAANDLREQVEQTCSHLKMECRQDETDTFNSLFKTLLEFGFVQLAMDCFRLMKLWEVERDESTYKTLIRGLESNGETDLSVSLSREAEEYLGEPLDFSEEEEETEPRCSAQF